MASKGTKSQGALLREIDALRRSRSWRLTAPLRAFAQSVHGLRGEPSQKLRSLLANFRAE